MTNENTVIRMTAQQLVTMAVRGEDYSEVGKMTARMLFALGMTVEQANATAQEIQDKAMDMLRAMTKEQITSLVANG